MRNNNIKIEDLKKHARKKNGECLSDIYINCNTYYKWKCENGHEWNSTWTNIYHSGRWCKKCGHERGDKKRTKYTIPRIKELLRLRSLPFELISEKQNKKRIYVFKCKICEYEWKGKAERILDGNKCTNCTGRRKKTVEDMKILGEKYGYEFMSETYEGCEKKYNWKCPNGHIWPAKPGNIRNGRNCPLCSINITEDKCRFVFEKLTGKKFPHNHTLLKDSLKLDGYCEELKMAFEYNGIQHYEFTKYMQKTKEGFYSQQKRDRKKKRYCKELGINLITIPHWEAESNKEIEKNIRSKLDIWNVEIDWNKYKVTTNKLNKVLKICEKKKIEYLMDYFPGRHGEAKLRCKICNNEWKTRISCIYKHGCPDCGHKKTWEKRRGKRSAFDDQWDAKYDLFKNWIIDNNGKYPSPHSKTQPEKMLGQWKRTQICIYRRGEMTLERKEKIKKLPEYMKVFI